MWLPSPRIKPPPTPFQHRTSFWPFVEPGLVYIRWEFLGRCLLRAWKQIWGLWGRKFQDLESPKCGLEWKSTDCKWTHPLDLPELPRANLLRENMARWFIIVWIFTTLLILFISFILNKPEYFLASGILFCFVANQKISIYSCEARWKRKEKASAFEGSKREEGAIRRGLEMVGNCTSWSSGSFLRRRGDRRVLRSPSWTLCW